MPDTTASENRRGVTAVLVLYILWSALLALGNYLFVVYPENEALGGLTLGLTSLVLGLIVPFHLLRTRVVAFEFLPSRQSLGKVIVATTLFAVFYLLVFPSGFMWQGTTVAFITNPPSAMTALNTFLSMLGATAAYGFVFWGGMLHALKNAYGNAVAVFLTSILFCVYHFSQFFIAAPTFEFLLMTFVGGLMLAAFTVLSECVLPTMIVHQLVHFVYFATLQDNPFADDLDRSIATLIMLVFLCGIYEALFRLIGRAGKGQGSQRKGKEGRTHA